MRGFGFFDRALWRRERERWIRASPPGPLDGRDPEPIAGAQSRIVVAQDDGALNAAGVPSEAILRAMLARGLCALTGEPDERAAWPSLLPELRPGQVLGIKLNTVAVHLVPHPEVVSALVASLAEAGVERRCCTQRRRTTRSHRPTGLSSTASIEE